MTSMPSLDDPRRTRSRRWAWMGLWFLMVWLSVRLDADAGKPRMIPPGSEPLVREFVARALGSDPETIAIEIDRDRIRVRLATPDAPGFVILHPDAEHDGEIGDRLAPGIVILCGSRSAPGRCTADEREPWLARARSLARERDLLVAEIWQIEESGQKAPVAIAGPARSDDFTSDRVLLTLGLLGSFVLLALAWRSPSPGALELARFEWVSLVGLLAVFVTAIVVFTSLWPLHEHNSFVARADCAIDPRCLEDPASAWSPTSLHAYGLILVGLGQPFAWLSWLSIVGVGLSIIVVVLVWALTRRLLVNLGRPELAPFGALLGAGLLCVHPVHWRLAGAASLWPVSAIGWLAAAVAATWACRRLETWAAALGWSVAACWLSVAVGGNLVLLTLLPLVVLAPLVWTSVGPDRAGLGRLASCAAASVPVFVVLIASDIGYGLSARSRVHGGDYPITKILSEFDPLLLDPSISAIVWAPLLVAASAWLIPRTAALAPGSVAARPSHLVPVLYAWAVPHAFLGVAGSDLVGSGYPVGFLNHYWELVGSAILVGLGGAWVLGAILARTNSRRWLGWATVVPIALALVMGPCAHEGWRMATEPIVVERELAALEQHLPELPDHDRLVVAPRILPTIEGVDRNGDPIEVVFPRVAYEQAMRASGFEPAVEDFEGLIRDPPTSGERVLVYVGTSLRSFVPEEIAAGVVPDGLERPELLRLRDDWNLDPALEFEIPTEQHEAASMRLGADRVPVLDLGFYWLSAR